MNNNKNSHQITPSGTAAHPEQAVPDNHPVLLLIDEDQDYGKLKEYIIVPKFMFWFFAVLSLLEGATLVWIFRHLAAH